MIFKPIIYLSDYNTKSNTVSNNGTKWNRFMNVKIAAGFCNESKLKVKVLGNAEENLLCYQQNNSKLPFWRRNMYGKYVDKVEFYVDSASNHTSKATVAYPGKKE